VAEFAATTSTEITLAEKKTTQTLKETPRTEKPKRSRDVNQRAYEIVQELTSEPEKKKRGRPKAEPKPEPEKNPAAVALGRAGGLARAQNMSKEQRSESARKAVSSRWASKVKS
jgi:hypothetical protein